MKAFHTVPHNRLLYKLGKYDIHQKYLNWIQNFLQGRTQIVIVKGTKSDPKPVISRPGYREGVGDTIRIAICELIKRVIFF